MAAPREAEIIPAAAVPEAEEAEAAPAEVLREAAVPAVTAVPEMIPAAVITAVPAAETAPREKPTGRNKRSPFNHAIVQSSIRMF